ncbi:MAG: hypothetical protein CMJ89_13925 [Planctomycetes bacterium]|nr:hypothetical protein [Planctomycetota bacterium]
MVTDRRDFLVNGIQVACSLSLLGLMKESALRKGKVGGKLPLERTLVVVQLSGGNDGLNMLVPHRQDAYYRARPTLALGRDRLHALGRGFGLHPQMGALARLFEAGKVAAIHGVGYPIPNRSHFRSMEIWHTADPVNRVRDHGWLGKLLDRSCEDPARASMGAIHVGGREIPLALRGETSDPTAITDARGLQLRELQGFASLRNGMTGSRTGEARESAYLRAVAEQSYRVSTRFSRAFERSEKADTPGYGLAQRLRLVAGLIEAGFGLRVLHLELTGFDTHAQQGRLHGALLEELSESLSAFQLDLEARGIDDRVSTLVFSEFGRRAAENGSRGTDHGAAGPVLLVGSRVRPGLHGTPPDLEALQDGDVPFTTDFRSIYTAVEKDWMGVQTSMDLRPMELFV